MNREAFEKAYHEETGLYASWSPNNKGYTDVIGGMCYRMWQAAQAQAGDGFVAQFDRLSNRNYELRMENADLKSNLQGIPVAVRFDWDGEGYQYMDNGSGSDWKTRIPDAELLYTRPQPAQVNQQLLEALQSQRVYVWAEGYENKIVVDPDDNGDFVYYDAVVAAIAAAQQRHGAQEE